MDAHALPPTNEPTKSSVEPRTTHLEHRLPRTAQQQAGSNKKKNNLVRDEEIDNNDDDDDLENNGWNSGGEHVKGMLWNFGLQSALGLTGTLRSTNLRYLARLLLFYALCSFAFLSLRIICTLWACSSLSVFQSHASTDTPLFRSPLQDLPNEHLMSKLSPALYPPPVKLEPFVVRAAADGGGLTACLWAWDEEVAHVVPVWASRWKDAISLLVATYHAPASPAATALLDQLNTMHAPHVSAHVLYLHHNQTAPNPNAFLNLARAFAQTDAVALFPASPASAAPPKTFYRSAAHVSPSVFSSSAVAAKPVIFSTRTKASFPFAPLSPVVLARDDPLWCTERFFPVGSRAADWAECLWQVWLERFGDVDVKVTTDWVLAAEESTAGANMSVGEVKARRRLTTKFRGETCVLATRQLAALRAPGQRVDAKKARWLKRHCRGWAAGTGRDS